MLESKFGSWDKGVFSIVNKIAGPTTTDTVHWFAIDTPNNKADNTVYSDTDITYKFNKYGFRSDEFVDDGKESILVIGCSFTIGLGVPLEHSWPYFLREMINPDFKLYNLSYASASADYIVRTMHKTLDVLKPSVVAILWPSYSARELSYRGHTIPFKPSEMVGNQRHLPLQEAADLLTDMAQIEYNYKKNKSFAKEMCESRKIPMLEMELPSMTLAEYLELDNASHQINAGHYIPGQLNVIGADKGFPVSRDARHFGKEWNKYIAEQYFTLYKGKNV